MSTKYVKTKKFKKTIGKACIVRGCTKSAKITTIKVNCGMRMTLAFCPEHASERGIVDVA